MKMLFKNRKSQPLKDNNPSQLHKKKQDQVLTNSPLLI
jgi:hypothetical protein